MATTQYTWNPLTDSVLEETDNLGNVNVTYTNEPRPFGPLLSENRGGQTNCYHFDAIGSTRLMTNSSQTVIDTNTFDAWGNSVASTGTTPTPYQWCGRFGYQYDSVLGSNYVRARTYQPAIGRWISVDPLSTWPWFERYLAYLLYVYVENTPQLYVDPSGQVDQLPCLNDKPTRPAGVPPTAPPGTGTRPKGPPLVIRNPNIPPTAPPGVGTSFVPKIGPKFPPVYNAPPVVVSQPPKVAGGFEGGDEPGDPGSWYTNLGGGRFRVYGGLGGEPLLGGAVVIGGERGGE